MPKAKRKSTTPKEKRTAVKEPRRGLAFIDASYQRKSTPEIHLKRELKLRRQPDDIRGLIALYDAYTAASNLILGISNQPRAEGIDAVLDQEWGHLLAKAWSVAEHIKTLRPTKIDQEEFVRTLVDCAFDMGGNAEDAASVFEAALKVGISPENQSKAA